ncbi:hypothetical protein LXL04_007191 [Taraxacum kok-saghyz]
MGGADQEEERGSPVAVNRGDGGGEREVSDSGDGSGGNGGNNNNVDSAYQQRYDLQQVSRWIEQILPFSLLLLIVFIRQHLQGFGYSDKPQPKYGFDYTLDALGSFIDELGVDKGYFAPIVVKYASNHQEKLNDLILLNPPVSIHPTFSITKK